MHKLYLYEKVVSYLLLTFILTFGISSNAQTSVVTADCKPEIKGLENKTYLPIDAFDKEIIYLSVSGIGFSVGTFQGSGANLLTSITGGTAQIDTRRTPAGEYNLFFTLDKYAHERCELGMKSESLTFFVDGDIAEDEINIPREYKGRVGASVRLEPQPSDLTYSIPEFRYSINPNNTTARAARVTQDGSVTAASAGKIEVVVTEINLLSASFPTKVIVMME
jgi:hypothetical protein